ncbi:MAG: PDZ domain-containing protein, partial [Hyphomicrobiales bacterium]
LIYRVTTRGMGNTAVLTIARGARRLKVSVPLRPAPEIPPRNTALISGDGPLRGARVANLSPALAEELQISMVQEGGQKGVVVVDVKPGTPARQIGLKSKDIIMAIGGKRVARVRDLLAQEARINRSFEIVIRRDGRVISSVVRYR